MFINELILQGVGFKAFVNFDDLYFQLGYSHYIKLKIPENIKIKAKKQRILVFSRDKQVLGQFILSVIKLKKPDVYKASGIRIKNKVYRLREGKKK